MALPECLFSWQRGSPSAIHVCVLLEDGAVYLSNEAILKFCVGLIAGRLAGKIVRGTGIGVIGDIAIGTVGAFIASWLLPRLGIDRHAPGAHTTSRLMPGASPTC